MNRLVIGAIIKMCTEVILLTAVIAAVIAIIGYINQWDSAVAYSNAFFLAGCVVIVAGTASRLGAGQDWKNFQLLPAESFRDMSSGERASYIVAASSPMHLVILGVLSGILLIIMSAIAAILS